MMSWSHDLFHPELKMTHFSNRTELEKRRYFTWCKLLFNYSDIWFYFCNNYVECSRSTITHFTPLSFSACVLTYSQSRGRKTVRVRFRGPLPQVAGGIVILLNIWFGFTQAAVTSLHQSHESHPVNLGQAADWSWYTSEAWRIPPTAEGYDVGRGNKWWWYQRKSAFCALLSLPGLQAMTALFFPVFH